MSNKKALRLIFYDFEVFYDDFCVTFITYPSMRVKTFVNDREGLIKFHEKIKDNYILCGYNNAHYDDIILKTILIGEDKIGHSLKEVSDMLVTGKNAYQISKHYYNFKNFVPTYDCMINKLMGLKQYEAFFGSKIYESNVDFNLQRKLTDEEMKETISYNIHDVQETIKLFELTKDDFNAQVSLIQTFNLPLSSLNKTKAKLSATILGGERVHGLNDEMQYGFPDTLILNKYGEIKEHFDKKRYTHYINEKGTKRKNQLDIEVYGLKTTYGYGGCHGALEKYYTDNSDGGLIVHSDVGSLYPNLMLEYNLLSRGVRDPKKYREILETRLALKHAGKKKEQAPYKIVLNSTYGITLDQYSSLYDPKHGRAICVYGQLLITDLVEKIEEAFGDDCIPIQYNTDGIIMKLKRKEDFGKYKEVCKEWETRTRLSLEHDIILKLYQSNVNNYVCIFDNGKLERKGKYFQENSLLKNDLPFLSKSIVNYLIYDKPVEESIKKCSYLDFQKVVKIGKNYKFVAHGDKPIKERVVRIFASKYEEQPGVFKVKDKMKEGVMIEGYEKIADTSEHCFIDNSDVTNKDIPEELDIEYYINWVKKEIKRMGFWKGGDE